MLDPLLHLTLALALASLFAVSAVHKLVAYAEWPDVVQNYRLVPEGLAPAVGVAVISAELVAAAALPWPSTRALGASLAAILLLAYAVAIGINVRRGRTRIDCGCFGSRLREGIAPWMVWRNLLLVVLALALWLPASMRQLAPVEMAFSMAAVVTLAFLYPVFAVVLRRSPPTFDQNYSASLRARSTDPGRSHA